MTATIPQIIRAPDWTVYHVTYGDLWAATVKLPHRCNGFDSISRYDFDTRTDAVDWALDLRAMRRDAENGVDWDAETCHAAGIDQQLRGPRA